MTGDVISRSADTTIIVPVAPMMHQEVGHSIANSLQLISSLLAIQAREACDQLVCGSLQDAAHRIDAVAAVHQQLHRSSSGHAVDIAPYLLELTAKIRQVCDGSMTRKQITTDIQSFEVPAEFASMLGIELVISACKHAYAPDETGNIDICLFFLNRSEFRMEVRDYGGIADVHKALITSDLDMRIIDAMSRKLNAVHVHIADEEGTHFLMRGTVFPTSVCDAGLAPKRAFFARLATTHGEYAMELYQVRYFLAVASTLNFTRAAEMCNVTQPALTKGVQKLEQELGGELIYRERQLTHLTDLGKAVLPMLERALASTEAVRHRARQFQQKEVAPLTIGLAPSISASLVLEPIAEIRKFVPGLHVELREEPASRLVELLLEGEINVALVGDLDDTPERIDNWALFEERYVAVLAPSHQLADLPVIGMEALRDASILDRSDCDVAPKFHQLCFPDASPHHNHRSNKDSHLQHLAAAGFGIILAPEHMPRLPSLKALPIEGDPVWREVRLLAVQGRRYSPALDAFVKVARLCDWSLHAGSSLRTEHQSHLEAKAMSA